MRTHLSTEQIRSLRPRPLKLNGIFIVTGSTQSDSVRETVLFNFLKGTRGIVDIHPYSRTENRITETGYYATLDKTSSRLRVLKDISAVADILNLSEFTVISPEGAQVVEGPQVNLEDRLSSYSTEVLYETEIPAFVRQLYSAVNFVDLGGGFYQTVVIK